CQQSHRSPLTF
nr:immunoglobulin light chain junction region [Macaca mulatta]